jgi:hypothetical protein
MTEKEVYEKLSEPFPKEAIQRTKKSDTGKGYNTTGYGEQYVVDRFNEVLGVTGWSDGYAVVCKSEELKPKDDKGRERIKYHYVLERWIKIHANPEFSLSESTKYDGGGNSSFDEGDAFKGAMSNSFKRVAAKFGVGRQAYAGEIDADNKVEAPDKPKIQPPQPKSETPKQEPPKSEPVKNEEKKEAPKPEIKNPKLKKENLEALLSSKKYINDIPFQKVLDEFKIKKIEDIPSDEVAAKIVAKCRIVYTKAAAVKGDRVGTN